jgi:flagellar assembly factor FliW
VTVLQEAAVAPRPPAAPPQLPLLTFTEPLPGFPRYRDYALVPAGAGGALYWLQSVSPDGPRFLAVSAASFFPDYAPVLPDPVRVELDVDDPAHARLYCVVTVPGGEVSAATANLRAPVVVNPATNRAQQVVLPDGGHPIRRPLRR